MSPKHWKRKTIAQVLHEATSVNRHDTNFGPSVFNMLKESTCRKIRDATISDHRSIQAKVYTTITSDPILSDAFFDLSASHDSNT